MVARFCGAGLGLLAFAVALIAGLWSGNPATVILSRGILALFVFCLLGVILGMIAEAVLAEFEQQQHNKLKDEFDLDKINVDVGEQQANADADSTSGQSEAA